MSRFLSVRWRAGALALAGSFALVGEAAADDQTSFIIDMTHAFYAKVSCPNLGVAYEGFVAAAKAKNLNPAVVEEVRNGVAYLNTNGQTGQRPRSDVMNTIVLAAKMITLDFQTGGVENWCKHRSQFLLRDGFVKKVP